MKKFSRIFYLRAAQCRKRCVVRGYTLLELSIAVSVAGVIAVAALKAIPALYDDYRASRFNQRLSEWVLNAEGFFLARSDYAGMSLSVLHNLGVFDGEVVTKNSSGVVTAVHHIFGGAINVGVPSGLSTMPFWGIHITGVPADEGRCVSILQYVAQIGKVVAVTAERGSATSALGDWLAVIAYDAGSSVAGAATAPSITGFPATYTVIKNLDGVQKSPVDLISTCERLGGERMGIAIVRKKL